MDSKEFVSIVSFLLSFLLFFHQSHARRLDFGSPLSSPSYSPAPGPNNGGCWFLSTSCRNGSLTACVDSSSTGSKEVIVFVKNKGERPLTVNVGISHAAKAKQINIVKEKQIIPPHLIKEVKIEENHGGNSSIHIDAGTLGCLIYIGSAEASSGGIFNYLPFVTHISPMNGAYLVFLTGLIIGSTCACCNRGKKGGEIRYQQLEMGQPAATPSANNNVETTAQGWEQDWDDQDWQHMANGSSLNGLSPRSSTKRDD